MQFKVLVFTAIALRVISAGSIPRTGPVGVSPPLDPEDPPLTWLIVTNPNNRRGVGSEDEQAEPSLEWLIETEQPNKRAVGNEGSIRCYMLCLSLITPIDEVPEPLSLEWLIENN
ncbi:hypothetical protein C8J57DRAFT_1337234 [Mycena rebaudengoi]|nr:hypothetical protein C8J57DRAFT_1337234 [Mycena rebaudengoi]